MNVKKNKSVFIFILMLLSISNSYSQIDMIDKDSIEIYNFFDIYKSKANYKGYFMVKDTIWINKLNKYVKKLRLKDLEQKFKDSLYSESSLEFSDIGSRYFSKDSLAYNKIINETNNDSLKIIFHKLFYNSLIDVGDLSSSKRKKINEKPLIDKIIQAFDDIEMRISVLPIIPILNIENPTRLLEDKLIDTNFKYPNEILKVLSWDGTSKVGCEYLKKEFEKNEIDYTLEEIFKNFIKSKNDTIKNNTIQIGIDYCMRQKIDSLDIKYFKERYGERECIYKNLLLNGNEKIVPLLKYLKKLGVKYYLINFLLFKYDNEKLSDTDYEQQLQYDFENGSYKFLQLLETKNKLINDSYTLTQVLKVFKKYNWWVSKSVIYKFRNMDETLFKKTVTSFYNNINEKKLSQEWNEIYDLSKLSVLDYLNYFKEINFISELEFLSIVETVNKNNYNFEFESYEDVIQFALKLCKRCIIYSRIAEYDHFFNNLNENYNLPFKDLDVYCKYGLKKYENNNKEDSTVDNQYTYFEFFLIKLNGRFYFYDFKESVKFCISENSYINFLNFMMEENGNKQNFSPFIEIGPFKYYILGQTNLSELIKQKYRLN